MDRQARKEIEYALEQIRLKQEEGIETLYRVMGRVMLFVANGDVHDAHTAEEVVKVIKGIRCGMKPTSCPDQLANALEQAIEAEKKNA